LFLHPQGNYSIEGEVMATAVARRTSAQSHVQAADPITLLYAQQSKRVHALFFVTICFAAYGFYRFALNQSGLNLSFLLAPMVILAIVQTIDEWITDRQIEKIKEAIKKNVPAAPVAKTASAHRQPANPPSPKPICATFGTPKPADARPVQPKATRSEGTLSPLTNRAPLKRLTNASSRGKGPSLMTASSLPYIDRSVILPAPPKPQEVFLSQMAASEL
jgi:hypothetical protein